MTSILVRERPPTALSICVAPPGGGPSYRWGSDDPNVAYAPDNISFSTSLPGGFSTFSCTLNRSRYVTWPDEQEFANLTVLGLGGRTVAWQGRLEQLPDQQGFQAQVNPQASGWQAHLDDDDSAAMIFVDQDLTNWQGPSVDRQIALLTAGDYTAFGSQSTGTSPANTPALITEFTGGTWTSTTLPNAEAWYDSGVASPIAHLYYKLALGAGVGASSPWLAEAYLSADDAAVTVEGTGNLAGGPYSGVFAPATPERFALAQFLYSSANTGNDGYSFQTYWNFAVVGNHGLAAQGAWPTSIGFFASDVIGYTIGKWCPKITYTTGTNGTIQASSFVIPQLAFTTPTTSSAIIKQAAQFELLDWAVWELGNGPTAQPAFYLSPYNASPFARQWQARVGPAQMQDDGPNVARIWNGVIVQFTAVDGTTQTVGPPGSGASTTSSQLLDSDPLNPANELGIRRWALVTMGTSTPAGAQQTGTVFLQAQKQLDASGQASLVGHVQDRSGVWWPSWSVRAGDQILFVDDPHVSSYRRIVSTQYDHSSRTNTIKLDQPPDSMTALLERLSIVLAPSGFS